MDKKFDFKDITLVPETISSINSRSEIDIFTEEGNLPLMVSPMDTVIDLGNCGKFGYEGYSICYPRGLAPFFQGFQSVSLDDFEKLIETKCSVLPKILVDIANGHMEKLYTLSKKFMEQYPYGDLMIGNIANPRTYEKFAEIGVKYIRVGIGGGSGCLTSANTGVHYPMASLIKECYEIKKQWGYNSKIVADGGFRNYDDIIKALALGADYVMLGGMLNKTLESCSDTLLFGKFKLSKERAEKIWERYPFMRKYFYKQFRGMSTKAVQKKWGRGKIKTSEGVHRMNKVEYTLTSWTENFKDYLRSAMSYTNSKNLESFKESEYVFITENARKRYDK
ncbi:MAG: guanosine 5-monophosphate oxidoreductase [Bacteroidota bacterium]|jgi:IMP dehydrogenase/GMP reductase